MIHRLISSARAVAAIAALVACADGDERAGICTSDSQCKAGRVCSAGQCTSPPSKAPVGPNASGAGGAAAMSANPSPVQPNAGRGGMAGHAQVDSGTNNPAQDCVPPPKQDTAAPPI